MANIYMYLYFLFHSGIPLEQLNAEFKVDVNELSCKNSNSTIFMQINGLVFRNQVESSDYKEGI